MFQLNVWKMGCNILASDTSIDSSTNEVFLQSLFIMTWEKCGGSCFTIILYMLHLTIKPYVSANGETVHINTCYSPSQCLPSKRLLQYDLVHTHFVGAQVTRLFNYEHFSLNKFGSLSITLDAKLYL